MSYSSQMEGIYILKRTDICVENVNDVVEDNIFRRFHSNPII